MFCHFENSILGLVQPTKAENVPSINKNYVPFEEEDWTCRNSLLNSERGRKSPRELCVRLHFFIIVLDTIMSL